MTESAPDPPVSSEAPTSGAGSNPRRRNRVRLGIYLAAIVITLLSLLLLLAAWRDDARIESDMGKATAEVLSAGKLRSAVSFVTPDGVTHNPELGVLYPTNLTAGQHIDVEYYRPDPDLVRVAGRDARVAFIPVASVVVVTWAIAITALYLERRMRHGRERPI